MRLAGKWRRSWVILGSETAAGRLQSVRIGNLCVDVTRLGRGDPIVLVPGLAGSWKLVVPLARALARSFEVYTCALRGDHFPSGGPSGELWGAWDLAAYARDVADLIGHLGLECPTVFGVSFGGAVALELAVEHPHRVGALILQGAEARFRTTIGSTIARLVLERFPLPRDNQFVNQFSHLLYGARPEPGPLVDFVVDRIWETDQSVMAGRLAQLESFDIRDRLWRIEAPTLVLAGSRDVIVSSARQQALAKEIPGARCEIIKDAGHIGFLTHRAQVAQHIRRFVQRSRTAVAH
jgi:pimeloyl-ACP methyl ester carboxylesterase